MSDATRFFRELSAAQRTALALGFVVILALAGTLGWWAFRAPYGVLFSDLNEQDAAVVVQELDKLKVPYQIGANGKALLVPEASVYKTRMALAGRQLPLHGAVGFELFNNAEFGVSDFVQKVNYQRALQGELTRTISSVEQIQSVRVHLALPEQGLFRKDASKAKASVTVVMKPGQALAASQVLGIQRLVGASVPEVRAEDVTVLDQHGVTLSRGAGDDVAFAAGVHLDSKLELESHLAAKATQLLDRMFGAGASLVTVDVLLNNQQTKVTTEEVLPAANLPKDQTPVGVIVRERTVTHEAPADGSKTASPSSTSQEMDYATGKRTEQVVSPSGNVSRINVAVVLKSAATEQDLSRVREVVAASVGAQPSRGDVVAVYSMAAVQGGAGAPAALPAPLAEPMAAEPAQPSRESSHEPSHEKTVPPYGLAALVAAAAVMALAWLLLARRSAARVSRQNAAIAMAQHPRLTDGERQSVLNSVQAWLAVPERRHEG